MKSSKKAKQKRTNQISPGFERGRVFFLLNDDDFLMDQSIY